MKFRLALHWQILIGMALGVGYGFLASANGWTLGTKNWIAPFGEIFIRMLKMIAVPLVLVSLINGVASLGDTASLGRMGGKAIVLYLITTVIAITIGLTAANVAKPGKLVSEETVQYLQEKYEVEAQKKISDAEAEKSKGPLNSLVELIPVNVFKAASDNGAMLQIIFFALLFGISLILIPADTSAPVKAFFNGANEVILKMVDIIMLYAPFGVFALMGGIIVDLAGDDPQKAVEILLALGGYSLTVIIGLGLMIVFIYPVMVQFFGKIPYLKFLKGIAPAQVLAFSTSSSAATLPVTMERCQDALGISKKVTSFVLPLGATINMDGTSLYQAVAALFLAQVFGVDLTMTDQLTILLTATLASIGSAAVPGAGMVMLVIVLANFPQIPASGIGLIFAVDRLLDMCRTTVNVTGDAAVTTIIAASEGEIHQAKENV
ncbi:MAG: dicarboxylate/amino acid:cation symporter [Flavobacteriales bacterium]